MLREENRFTNPLQNGHLSRNPKCASQFIETKSNVQTQRNTEPGIEYEHHSAFPFLHDAGNL